MKNFSELLDRINNDTKIRESAKKDFEKTIEDLGFNPEELASYKVKRAADTKACEGNTGGENCGSACKACKVKHHE